ncbi:hypothetical protein D3C87_2150020 [compost metagenome]
MTTLEAIVSHTRNTPRAAIAAGLRIDSSSGMLRYTTTRRSKRRPLRKPSATVEYGVSPIMSLL